jgi:hypothetical protein
MSNGTPRPWRKLIAGAGALALGDLVVGLASFSSITLASLWYFSWEWIHLRGEYLAHGLSFGSNWQYGLAWFGVLSALPLLVFTIFLAVRAIELPRRFFRFLRGSERPATTAGPKPKPRGLPRSGLRPDYIARFWA